MQKLSRREFLKNSSALAASAASLDYCQSLFATRSEPDLKFPTAPRERLAVATWPFRMFLESPANRWGRDPKLPGMDMKEFGAMVVQTFGLRNIEPLDQHFRSTDMAYVHALREAMEKVGARVVNIPVGVGASFYDPDPAKRQEAVREGKRWVDIAVVLNSPSIRTAIQGPLELTPDVDRAAESLGQVAAYGAENDVIVTLENDNNWTEDPFFLVKILEKVNNPYLRALPDFCNSMLTHDQEFNNRALEALFQHAFSIAHVKDSELDGKGKLVTVDVAKCFEIAKASGFRGYYSLEWEGQDEPYGGTQKLIDLSLKYLG